MYEQDIASIPACRKEELNHQAYLDVLNCDPPARRYDEFYMYCYRQWKALTIDEFLEN
jgi:hypothetical protein